MRDGLGIMFGTYCAVLFLLKPQHWIFNVSTESSWDLHNMSWKAALVTNHLPQSCSGTIVTLKEKKHKCICKQFCLLSFPSATILSAEADFSCDTWNFSPHLGSWMRSILAEIITVPFPISVSVVAIKTLPLLLIIVNKFRWLAVALQFTLC